jgi:hypothetical protein
MKYVCDLIKNSEGIVVVYSQFVWSGIVPLAIALEHMGYTRYGTHNILHANSAAAATASAAATRGYVMLTGDDMIMGSTKIEDILPVLNSQDNMHGERIKVVLMTPIAGEGLSFKNAREMHVLEPWYHMNRIEQVIGRAIRTCSHKLLPQEERNVTVYLHACVDSTNTKKHMLSPDIHAYKISARKVHETKIAEEAIRDNAIDCALLKHVNYYPQDIFPFSVGMRTSQGNIVSHTYGDLPETQPVCANAMVPRDRADARSMRPDLFDGVVSTLLMRLTKYIQSQMTFAQKVYFPVSELVHMLKAVTVDDTVIKTALVRSLDPYVLIEGFRMLPHMNGIIVVPRETPSVVTMVRVPSVVKAKPVETTERLCNVADIVATIVRGIKDTNPHIGTHMAYTIVDSACWRSFATQLVARSASFSEAEAKVAMCFAHTGALVAEDELPVGRLTGLNAGRKFAGFVDIFSTSKTDTFEVSIYDAETFQIRSATDTEVASIKAKRDHTPKPQPRSVNMLSGILEPTNVKKDPTQPYRNVFKVLGANPKKNASAATTGAVCDKKTKEDLTEYLKQVGVTETAHKNREQLCFTLAIELLKNDNLFVYPEWKPKSRLKKK